MAKSNDYRMIVGICAGLIGASGLANSFYYYHQYGFNSWTAYVQAAFYVVCGIIGVLAVVRNRADLARLYTASLGFTMVAAIIFSIVSFFISKHIISQACRDAYDKNSSVDINDCEKLSGKLMVIAGIINIFILVLCCSGCMFCSHTYYKELKKEEGGDYQPIASSGVRTYV